MQDACNRSRQMFGNHLRKLFSKLRLSFDLIHETRIVPSIRISLLGLTEKDLAWALGC